MHIKKLTKSKLNLEHRTKNWRNKKNVENLLKSSILCDRLIVRLDRTAISINPECRTNLHLIEFVQVNTMKKLQLAKQEIPKWFGNGLQCCKLLIGYNEVPHIITQNCLSMDWSPNWTTCLIPGPIWPTIRNYIHTLSAVSPQCTIHTQTNQQMVGGNVW